MEGSPPFQPREDYAVPMLSTTSHINFETTGVIKLHVDNKRPHSPRQPPALQRLPMQFLPNSLPPLVQNRPPVLVAGPPSIRYGPFVGGCSPSDDIVYDLRAPARIHNIEEDDSSVEIEIDLSTSCGSTSSISSEDGIGVKNGFDTYPGHEPVSKNTKPNAKLVWYFSYRVDKALFN